MHHRGIPGTVRVGCVCGVSRTPAGGVGPSFWCMNGASTDIQADSAKTAVITSISPCICANTVSHGSADPASREKADIVHWQNGYRGIAMFSLCRASLH